MRGDCTYTAPDPPLPGAVIVVRELAAGNLHRMQVNTVDLNRGTQIVGNET